jgi:hypothetical protein
MNITVNTEEMQAPLLRYYYGTGGTVAPLLQYKRCRCLHFYKTDSTMSIEK